MKNCIKLFHSRWKIAGCLWTCVSSSRGCAVTVLLKLRGSRFPFSELSLSLLSSHCYSFWLSSFHVLVTASVRMVCLLRCAALWWPVTSDLSAVLPASSSVCWSHMWLTPAPLCACSRPPCTASRRENTSCAAPLGLALGPWHSLFLPLERTSFWVLIAAAVHNNNKKWIILWVIQFVSYFCNKSSWVLEASFSISHLPSGELIW